MRELPDSAVFGTRFRQNAAPALLSLGARVEENLRNSVRAVERGNDGLGKTIVESDEEVDKMEVELEEECLKILALHQPVAIDLRYIVAVLKINNDVERIGDEAVNIARHARYFSTLKRAVEIPFDFDTLVEKTKEMVKKGLDALVRIDSRIAKEVIVLDAIDCYPALRLVHIFHSVAQQILEHL